MLSSGGAAPAAEAKKEETDDASSLSLPLIPSCSLAFST
jgi:hypothetical protein